MVKFAYTVTDEVGIHARPAGMLINKVKSLGCKVTVEKDGKTADASKLFSLMVLSVKHGDTITVTVHGDTDAANELEEFFKANL